jgi:serine/threonine protein kinase
LPASAAAGSLRAVIGGILGQKYQLSRLLGRGGMGAVYEAERVDTGERVAVKVLHGHLVIPGGDGPRRFRREAAAVRAIRGEHIPRVIDAGADRATGQLYLVTELLDGEDLQRLLDRVGPLSVGGALAIAAQALLGLCDAHAAGVVHRDIKPANLFLSRADGGALRVKLLDFGIAKVDGVALAAAPTADPSALSLTSSGSFLGSPLYMSPEQIQNSREVDHRTDLWSLGCVLYAALSGRAPHQHLTSLGQLLVAICVSKPPPLLDVAPWVPPEVAAVIHRALQLDPEARFPTAAAMLEAVRALGRAETIVEDMLTSSGRRPRDPGESSSREEPLSPGQPGQRSTGIPFSPAGGSPRVVVVSGRDRVSGEEATMEVISPRGWSGSSGIAGSGVIAGSSGALDRSGLVTLDSEPDHGVVDVARSGVPVLGVRQGARMVTVDPRRYLGERTELWTFSLDVHRHVTSLVSRIWKSLRRAGAQVAPMSYGVEWALHEPRTGRTLELGSAPSGERKTLEEAGIRAGTILWVVRPGAGEGAAEPR